MTGAYDAKRKFTYSTLFLSFSSLWRKRAERVHEGKNVRWLKGRHTRSTMGASIARKRTGLGPRVLRHQLAQTCPTSCIMTCFLMRCDGLPILKACWYIFDLNCAFEFGTHVTGYSAVRDTNVGGCMYSCSYVLLVGSIRQPHPF